MMHWTIRTFGLIRYRRTPRTCQSGMRPRSMTGGRKLKCSKHVVHLLFTIALSNRKVSTPTGAEDLTHLMDLITGVRVITEAAVLLLGGAACHRLDLPMAFLQESPLLPIVGSLALPLVFYLSSDMMVVAWPRLPQAGLPTCRPHLHHLLAYQILRLEGREDTKDLSCEAASFPNGRIPLARTELAVREAEEVPVVTTIRDPAVHGVEGPCLTVEWACNCCTL